ncbi:hypothetical protein Lal_00008239 [Lupinus albus]|nr:hypothetical protein Lal_00008239 [Lupinus albus]
MGGECNGESEDTRKINWNQWDNVCKDKFVGMLTVKDINLFNLVLLSKWKWRLLHEDESLWSKVLNSKYSEVIYDPQRIYIQLVGF